MGARRIFAEGANPEASLCCSSLEGYVWVYNYYVYCLSYSPISGHRFLLLSLSIRCVSIYCRFPSLGCQPAFVSLSIAPLSAFLPPFLPSSLHSLCFSVSLFSLLLSQVFVSNLSYLSLIEVIAYTISICRLYHLYELDLSCPLSLDLCRSLLPWCKPCTPIL